MSQIKTEAYLYSTARFRAKAAMLPSSAQLLQMAEAKDVAECVRQLDDAGISIGRDEEGRLAIEQSLDTYLSGCFDEVASCTPEPRMVDIFRYPYDAHNVKSLLKCRERGINPFPLLMSMGTVSAEDAELSVREGNYHLFSTHIAEAIPQAIALYAQTSDPQLIDAVVDAGCFADMLEKAGQYGDFLMEAIQTKIDTINILTALRILRMGGLAYSYYSQHFISGGKLSEGVMQRAFEGGEQALISELAHTPYGAVSKAFAGEAQARLSAWEGACEAFYRKVVRKADSQLTGAETLFSYLADREYEVKQIRILLTAKQAEMPAQKIKSLLNG